MTPVVIFGSVMLACALLRAPDEIKQAWLPRINGWQKLSGGVAFIVALLIAMNPEFLALGLVGDAAFFDALVLLLSLQLQTSVARGWRGVRAASTRARAAMVRQLSFELSLVLCLLAAIGGGVVTAIQKAAQRISS